MSLTAEETAELASLKTTLLALNSGKQAASITDSTGRKVTYASADRVWMQRRIAELDAKSDSPTRRRGALRFYG